MLSPLLFGTVWKCHHQMRQPDFNSLVFEQKEAPSFSQLVITMTLHDTLPFFIPIFWNDIVLIDRTSIVLYF